MNDIERLSAIESIKQLKARYFRFMDTKDWANLETLFSADAVMDMRTEVGNESGLVQGGHNVAAFMRQSTEFLITVHHGHTPEIEITSATTARGIWAMEDKLWNVDGAAKHLAFKTLHGYGHYHETYIRVDGHWLIQSTRLTRLRLDIT
jgi:hypothetical protein